MRLILASTSPRRKEILSKTGLGFDVVVNNYEEDMTLDMPPKELAAYLSLGKAKSVANQYPDALVIGADTIVAFKDKILGKPKSVEEAKEMLTMLSGEVNSVITGFTMIHQSSNRIITDAIESFVTFRKMSEEEIDNYIATGEPMDKAGAYAIQEKGAIFVEKIEGDFFTIIGLPLYRIAEELKQFGITIL
ncbi:septum formation inhibitor Maf [candidate division KSB1 bacterium]|nr:MAG: septum formation inhibitor Maf [candidate division KSB1 bacterium]